MKKSTPLVIAAVAALSAATHALAQDAFVKFYQGSNAIGGFSPTPDGAGFYVGNFSPDLGFYLNTPSGAGTLASSTQLFSKSDITKFEQSSSLLSTLPSDNTGGSPFYGDLILNPAPVTLTRQKADLTYQTITYPAGTLAFVIDQAGKVLDTTGATRYDLTKIGYFYDLRTVGTTPTGSTDRALFNRNADSTIDWNDVFEPVISEADERSAANNYTGTAAYNTLHHPAFAPDASAIYFIDHAAGAATGGLYRIKLSPTGGAPALTRVLTNSAGINSEPSVIASSAHAFSAAVGNQIVVPGAADMPGNPNAGGISYVVDDGSSTTLQAKTLLSVKQIQGFLETTTTAGVPNTPVILATGSDTAGNLYVYNSTDGGVFKYDAANHLSKVFSNAELIAFQTANSSSVTKTIVDMKVSTATYNGQPISQLQYSDTRLQAPVGVNLFAPGDFNRDLTVDASDVAALKYVLAGQDPDAAAHPSIYPRGLRGAVTASILSASPFTKTNSALFKYDLNGSFTSGTATAVSVDWKDVKIFQQVYNDYQIAHTLPTRLSDGDVNMDFTVDAADLSIIGANYNGTSKIFTEGNLTSVRIAAADKDTVNYADLVTLAANWTAAKPAFAAVGSIPAADLDRAFAITANGTLSQYQAAASGTWSNAANWTAGVPNAAGAVASLLTKPQDDTTVTLDGAYTVGQLNFDNYFTYTLAGGTLRLQGANGSQAELNAFAASPTISSALQVLSDTKLTVTYAADTVTLAGPTSIAAGKTLSKTGPGLLKFTGGGTGTGALSVAAGGSVEVAANLTVGSLSGAGALSLTGTATRLTLAQQSSPTPSALGSLTLAAGTTLDLTNNSLSLPAASLASAVASLTTGYNAGLWTGAGIASSLAAADPTHTTSLGYLSDGTTLTIAYTFAGDANLDGKITPDDYALLDRGFNKHLTTWQNGDFNYDGTINSADYLILDRTYLTQSPGFDPAFLAQRESQFGESYVSQLIASVPEPTSLLAASALALPLLRRTRNPR